MYVHTHTRTHTHPSVPSPVVVLLVPVIPFTYNYKGSVCNSVVDASVLQSDVLAQVSIVIHAHTFGVANDLNGPSSCTSPPPLVSKYCDTHAHPIPTHPTQPSGTHAHARARAHTSVSLHYRLKDASR